MLQLKNVVKTYLQGSQRVDALRGISMTIDSHGFFAVMGPSGSGKTTLLHLAAGLDQADSGSVVVGGEDLTSLSESKLTLFRRRKIGVVFQKFNLIPTLTAEQNVALPGVIDRTPRRELEPRVKELMEQLGIAGRARHRPDALSGGEQQRVAIARALLFKPAVILADEPTGNLDSANSLRLWQQLAELAVTQKVTVIMVTHEPAAAAHCQRVFVLGDGLLKGEFEVTDRDPAGVATRYQQFGR